MASPTTYYLILSSLHS
ncbi:hypothetical protein LINPERPRIM_LOCUS25325 [Linum perenne]